MVLFDLDGTLVDSEEVILKSFDFAFKTFLPEYRMPLEGYTKFLGPTLKETFSKYTSDESVMASMEEAYLSYYRAAEFKMIKLYPHTIDMLKALKDRGIIICLITNKYLSSATPSMNFLNIMEYFSDIYAHGMAPNPKPSPDLAYMALNKYNILSSEALLVGDNVGDILCAKNAHIKSVLMSFNSWSEDARIISNPDYYIDDLNKILDIVEENNKYVYIL